MVSCVYKRLFPNIHITTTDICEFAFMSLYKCEQLYDVKIDNSYACTSYQIEEEDVLISSKLYKLANNIITKTSSI